MAHFYGRVQGQAGEATRLGSKRSGIFSTVQTWGMTLRADLDHFEREDIDILSVRFQPSSGYSQPILTLRDPDKIASVSDDPEVRRLFEQMHEVSKRIEKAAEKAHRRKLRERKQRQREQEALARLRNANCRYCGEPSPIGICTECESGIHAA